jgi:hypothetical protein
MTDDERKVWLENLRSDLWQLIAGVELTQAEGEVLIQEIRLRMRRP